ncbi:MAG: hypothetical protein WA874_02290 [Chryseosolibacter sp.]
MENQLKHLYGRRTTPGVKILMLVVIIFLGLHLAFSEASHSDKNHAPADTSIDIQSSDKNG